MTEQAPLEIWVQNEHENTEDEWAYGVWDGRSEYLDYSIKYIRADQPLAVAVKPLAIAEQYAEPIIETDFGDYVMHENKRYSDKPVKFLGRGSQPKKFHIKLNGMLILHTDNPDDFLRIVQADYERRINEAVTARTEAEVKAEIVNLACDAVDQFFDNYLDQPPGKVTMSTHDLKKAIRALTGSEK